MLESRYLEIVDSGPTFVSYKVPGYPTVRIFCSTCVLVDFDVFFPPLPSNQYTSALRVRRYDQNESTGSFEYAIAEETTGIFGMGDETHAYKLFIYSPAKEIT
jgi:hypothetical protein